MVSYFLSGYVCDSGGGVFEFIVEDGELIGVGECGEWRCEGGDGTVAGAGGSGSASSGEWGFS